MDCNYLRSTLGLLKLLFSFNTKHLHFIYNYLNTIMGKNFFKERTKVENVQEFNRFKV